MGGLQAGAGKRVIAVPQDYLAVENFGMIHDPIHARAVAIRQEKAESTVILVSLEITSMPGEETEAIRTLIAGKTGVREENIWVCVTHSFSSPHLLPDHFFQSEAELALKNEYREALQSAAVGAAADAVEHMQSATLAVGAGDCGIVASRDIETADGWWVGTNGDGPTNRTVTVLRFNDLAGQPIALISHFAIQSSVMDQSELSDGKKPVTSDIAGNACRKVEEESGESLVCLFLIGAAADQAPIEKAVNETFENGEKIHTDLHEEGFAICERLSEKLKKRICEIAHEAGQSQTRTNSLQENVLCSQKAQSQCRKNEADGCSEKAESCEENPDEMTEPVIKVTSASLMVPAKHMNRDLHSLRPTRHAVYEPDGESETTIEAIRIGDLALLGVKPELTCKTAASIAEQSGFGTTLICTLVNGASKYMADESAYDRSCYEAQNSPFGRGAAELLAAKAVEMLKNLK
ncbi:MAG: hypothetical protein LUD16_07930 [Lachnospiraceae bacterium]|nr:hypothetical protein [Lachnospiraceae bacterium]